MSRLVYPGSVGSVEVRAKMSNNNIRARPIKSSVSPRLTDLRGADGSPG